MLSFFKGQVKNQMAFSTIGLLISEEVVLKKHKGKNDPKG